jgi:hypothetical protein
MLELSDQWYAMGFATDDGNKFQGFHPQGGHIMVIVDEAAGVAEEIFEVIEGILTNEYAILMMIGNPTSTSGKFYDTHHSLRDIYKTVHISALDSPNFTGERIPQAIAPKLVQPKWVRDREREWGADSPLFKSRVLGEFPDQSDKSLIALSWVESARNRFINVRINPRDVIITQFNPSQSAIWRPIIHQERVTLGADIARYGSAESAVYIRKGPYILHSEFWRKVDLMETAGRIRRMVVDYSVECVNVDATGIGAGVADRLRETCPGVNINAVIVGSSPTDKERFRFLRDEIFWALRERLREGEIGPLLDNRTQAQLTALQYTHDSRGKIQVETKEEMAKRGLPSPDRADALALAFAPVLLYQQKALAGGNRPVLSTYQVR